MEMDFLIEKKRFQGVRKCYFHNKNIYLCIVEVKALSYIPQCCHYLLLNGRNQLCYFYLIANINIYIIKYINICYAIYIYIFVLHKCLNFKSLYVYLYI